MTTKRKIAPQVTIKGHIDKRAEYIARYVENDPDFEYSYQRPEVTDWELEYKNQEIVMKNGKRDHWMGDPIVKTPRKLKEAQRYEEAERSRMAAEAVVDNTRSTFYRSPKTPIERKKR